MKNTVYQRVVICINVVSKSYPHAQIHKTDEWLRVIKNCADLALKPTCTVQAKRRLCLI